MRYHQPNVFGPPPLWIRERDVKCAGEALALFIKRACPNNTPERRRVLGYVQSITKEVLSIVRKDYADDNGADGVQEIPDKKTGAAVNHERRGKGQVRKD